MVLFEERVVSIEKCHCHSASLKFCVMIETLFVQTSMYRTVSPTFHKTTKSLNEENEIRYECIIASTFFSMCLCAHCHFL